ncbi:MULTISPECIES: DNA polymerase III subunit beta [Stenotrophomonas]|jgi:DNA polymerase-3 subunit beta|uniref:Beta sliding clamp n=1 Tax=Stenotrophomonas acidaminiphila TaxID=128780 RepID=A0A0S1AUL0_9GAMM|nr:MULTISPECIES: DNA polymerase III subunit beta [Stenotrophomonas]ODU47140.1 MAG: DNA polymerase III subunit beta [Xanthomonadaceae bacterium SCN 69-123]OJY72915.1 MAG: DNA polymerase III subunit beta [Stenotrophomonas sp. 69-14]OZB52026.1 MAG: DNA polymerase III subunit beta [Stenotrophomonas sp. 14-69-23]ALJ26470.1 DNA polymerase III subunit beta [Stenotrophomonas acidaminiphila]MBN8800718.1 DNA polymerase III subunit beta [Stenotrophomonas acidaminiphila]
MRFTLQREAFLKPLAQVVNVVERRQTLPVLANFLVQVQGGQLSLTGTDLEVEMVSRIAVEDAQDGETTIPARKLFEIVRALPDGSRVTVSQTGEKITVQAGRSRFTLATLPANDFPSVDEVEATERVAVPESALKELIERTAFAMAQQDVRYYLNGLLFDLRDQLLRCVATDGHRLALCETALENSTGSKRQIIVPRKGVTELQRLLEGGDREVELEVGRSHVRVKRDDVTFTSKLIDGRFPDYEAVIPIGADREVKVDRETLRASLQRAAILSNEKYRGVRVEVTPGQLKISAHNPEQEEAQEEIEAETQVSDLAIGFNVNYLLDALSALRDEHIVILLRDSNSSALVREASSEKSRHVVMPLRL